VHTNCKYYIELVIKLILLDIDLEVWLKKVKIFYFGASEEDTVEDIVNKSWVIIFI